MKDLSGFHDLPLAKQREMLEGPAMKPPVGARPNFAHPPNHDEFGFGLLVTVSVVTTLLVASRMYARCFYHKKVTVGDAAAISALGAFAAFVYFTWRVIDSPGLLVHQWNIKFKEMPDVLYNISAGSTVYGIVIMLLKVGILLHWAEIFVPAGLRNGFWWTCHVTIGINVLFYVICTFIEIFGCTPRAKLWDITLKGKCMNMQHVIIASAFINFISDLIILLLPQKVIWSLNLSTRRKFGTAALFAVGIFATACAGFRIKSTFDFARTEDVTYVISELGLWCLAEMVAGFFVLCLPSMPKLFKNSPWIKKLVSSFRSMSKSTSQALGRSSEGNANHHHAWPRSKPRRAPDESLFADTDTNTSGFVRLTNYSNASNIGTEQTKHSADMVVSKVESTTSSV